MALSQLDAFEFRAGDEKVVTVYQLLDDAARFDVGSWAYRQHENSHDAQDVTLTPLSSIVGPIGCCQIALLGTPVLITWCEISVHRGH